MRALYAGLSAHLRYQEPGTQNNIMRYTQRIVGLVCTEERFIAVGHPHHRHVTFDVMCTSNPITGESEVAVSVGDRRSDHQMGFYGSSRCAPTDMFDLERGTGIALVRALDHAPTQITRTLLHECAELRRRFERASHYMITQDICA